MGRLLSVEGIVINLDYMISWTIEPCNDKYGIVAHMQDGTNVVLLKDLRSERFARALSCSLFKEIDCALDTGLTSSDIDNLMFSFEDELFDTSDLDESTESSSKTVEVPCEPIAGLRWGSDTMYFRRGDEFEVVNLNKGFYANWAVALYDITGERNILMSDFSTESQGFYFIRLILDAFDDNIYSFDTSKIEQMTLEAKIKG